MAIYSPALCQCHHMEKRSTPVQVPLCTSAAMWWHCHTCSHRCHLPGPPLGSEGLPVCIPAMSHDDRHLVAAGPPSHTHAAPAASETWKRRKSHSRDCRLSYPNTPQHAACVLLWVHFSPLGEPAPLLEAGKLSDGCLCQLRVRRQGIHTLGNSFRELVRFNGGEEGVFNAPGEVDGLGQGGYAHAQLTRSEVLEDVSSTYSRVGRPRGKPSKLKQGVKPSNCQGSEFLLGLMLGEPAFWHPIGRQEGASAGHPHLRYLGLELSSTLPPTNPGSLWSHTWAPLFLHRFPRATTWWPWHTCSHTCCDPGDGHVVT